MSSTSRTDPITMTIPVETDPGKRLMQAFIRELLRRIETPDVAQSMTASELELIRKVMTDNSISLSSIRSGDFGQVAQRAAEEFPFPDGPVVMQ